MLASLLSGALLAAVITTPFSIVPPMRVSDIARKADLVVSATAVAASSRWEDGGRTIRTHVRFAQLTVHKGAVPGGPATGLSLRFDGGEVGGMRIDVSDMPRPRVGKRYLMFVAGNGRSVSPIVGFHQGIFEIVEEPGRQVLKNMEGLELAGVRDDRFVFVLPALPARPERPMPTLGKIEYAVQRAHPDAARLERAMLAERPRTAAPLPQLPAARASATPASGADRAPAPPPVVGRGEVPDPDAAPVILPATADRGERASVRSLLATVRSVTRTR